MEKPALTVVKAILKSLVISCPGKITVEQLNRDYREFEGQFIPFRQLGFGNLELFLHSIPDTLRVFGSGPTAKVCSVANEKTEHIHDMIMKQKKTKSKSLSRAPRKTGQNRNNAFCVSNAPKPFSVNGQQLSPYQSVNRKQTVKTVRGNSLVQRPKYEPQPAGKQLVCNLPQPDGILPKTDHCTIQNGIVKPISTQKHLNQTKVNQLSNSLTKKCYVSEPPPSVPRSENRNDWFPAKNNKFPIHDGAKSKQEAILRKFYDMVVSHSEPTDSPIQNKPPTAKQQVSMKFPEQEENVLQLSNQSNHIKGLNNLTTQETKEAGNTQNVKTVSSTQPKKCFDVSVEFIEDPDEAIPSFAAKSNVFRLDFPEHTVSYGSKIAPYKLSDEITVGCCLKIFISEIHSPFKFWFHIHKENHELDSLMYQIERYYSVLGTEDLQIPMTSLTPGQVCAASYNDLWHRAEIVAPPFNKSIKVSFMDYGTVSEVEIKNIKFLPTYFAQLPAQALRGCLSHIKPRHYHWGHEATKHFLKLVAELMLYAKVTEIDEKNNVLYVILCDTNGDEVIQINSSLVNNHYAFYNEDWRADRIMQNNGQRVHHPREDYPTFDMIESGEYPNFTELVTMLQRGIDYETIHDIILFNQSSILNKHECACEGLKNLPYFLITSNPFTFDVVVDLYTTSTNVL